MKVFLGCFGWVLQQKIKYISAVNLYLKNMIKDTATVINNLLHDTTIQLEDAQALSRKYNTFHAPKWRDLKKVKKDSTVKICDGKERFWVQVENRKDDLFLGRIRNNLSGMYTYGDMIAFKETNIYGVSKY